LALTGTHDRLDLKNVSKENMERSKSRRYVPDLVSDMAECDANYIRLLRLFPHMAEQDALSFGVQGATQVTSLGAIQGITEDGARVVMQISERCPYTTMLSVQVTSEDDQPWVKWPVLEVRIYHDIKSAEVTGFERHRNFRYRYQTPNPDMFQPDEKSQINRFFGELLSFCIEHGHSLEPVFLDRGDTPE
jgi:uncharacterized protein|tara:strand:+ start:19655 stop:20224 length:570 start_codon:yes stop_codon:yes gene_type:complete